MPTERLYVVDRVEGETAVLVDDAKAAVQVSARRLPRGIREGAVLRVPIDPTGEPRWEEARPDAAEAARRRAEAEDRLKRLKQRDPGGDVTL